MEGTKRASSQISKISLPFYESPAQKTSAEIINEARLAIRGNNNSFTTTSIKPLQTIRPFTPRVKERLLFGKRTKNRPPSSFSLKYLQTEADFCIPPSTPENGALLEGAIVTSKTNHQRSHSLSEISDGRIFNLGVKEPSQKIRLPSLENIKTVQKRKFIKNTYSLDNLPEEGEVPYEPPVTRNAFSSPQERTDCNETFRSGPRPANLSQYLLLEPQNLNRIFENKEIVSHSGTLFAQSGYMNGQSALRHQNDDKRSPKLPALNVDTVIDSLNRESASGNGQANEGLVVGLLNSLYDCMESEGMLKTKVSGKSKIHILKCLYKYVESQNEELLLAIARIILALKVTGNNLSGVCKLIFKVSKSDKNDQLFFNRNLLELFIDAISRSSPLEDAEACVYGYGSIKFLSMNEKLLQKLLSLGVLPLLVLHIKLINNAKCEKVNIAEQINHALFQLTGALRNIAADEDICEKFVTTQAVSELCEALELFGSDLDIISNIARIFSTISTNEECCDAIASCRDIHRIFIGLFEKYAVHEEIIVRLTFTMGNIVANVDETRKEFYIARKSIPTLLHLWGIYLERTLKCCSLSIDCDNTENSNCEDVMIKIIRIIANIAINPDIGKSLNEEYGSRLIDEFLKVLISNPFKKNEELVLSVLSTLNNLSFYYSPDMDEDVFHMKQIDVVEAIGEYLRCSNKESVTEAMRILGNLTRSKITRDSIANSAIFHALVPILDGDEMNLIKTTVGVFVNLMSDSKHRRLFQEHDGISKLITVLNHFGQYDWTLSMLACQVIWNYCIDTTNLYEDFTDAEIQQLIAVMMDFLDEEKLFGIMESHQNDDVLLTNEYIAWEEFANVGTNLLEKFENFLEKLVNERLRLEKRPCLGSKPATVDSSTNISFAAC